MTTRRNLASEANAACDQFEVMVQQAADKRLSRAAMQAQDDEEQAAWLKEQAELKARSAAAFLAAHPRQPGRGRTHVGTVLTVLACVLVGVIIALVIVAEMLGPRY